MKTRKPNLAHYLRLPYTFELRPNDDGTWFAQVRELPGGMTEGDTEQEAVEMLKDAMRAWIEVALQRGIRIPEPRPQPAHSGRFVVRVPKSLHRDLARRAEEEGTSLNQLVVSVLSRAAGSR